MASSAGRHLWRNFRAILVEPVLGSRCLSSQNAGKGKQIWEQGFSPRPSSSSPLSSPIVIAKREGASSLADGAGFATGNRIAWTELLGRKLPNCNLEGLSILVSTRPDAALVVRSAVAMRRRSKQLMNFPAAFLYSRTSTPGLTGTRMLHGRAALSSPIIAKRKLKQSLPRFENQWGFTGCSSRRNLSSAGSSWTDSWNRATEKLKKAINWRPATKAGGAVGGTGVKSSVAQGRQGEILSNVAKPVKRTYNLYKEAAGLQLEGFWKRNYLWIVGVIGLGVCLLLWRLMYAIASTFISMSEGLAKYGVLALAASMVLVSGVYLRARYTINPDAVYRAAMRKLNTSASVLEVMGAPLTGTDVRAYVMSGGGFRLKNFKPTLAGKRCFVIFPITGSERRGLVSIEVKKKKGQYNFKLLAVDIPAAGADQRLYLIGDEKEYTVGGGLIGELRDPIVRAMAAQKEFEETDLAEEEEDERLAVEAEILQAEKARKEYEQRQDKPDEEQDRELKKQEQKILA